jgi:hypothetical protein
MSRLRHGKVVVAAAFALLAAACGGTDSGLKVPDELPMCSGRGTVAPADNMQSLCQCDAGYEERMWGLAFEDDIERLMTSLCVKSRPPALLGLTFGAGLAPAAGQAKAMAEGAVAWTLADLPADLSGLPQTMGNDAQLHAIGRIRLDDVDLTPESAREAVDAAMQGAAYDFVVLQDAALYDAPVDMLEGCNDWACFGQVLKVREESICRALSRIRLHCPWCEIGFAIANSPNEHLTMLNFDMKQSGMVNDCQYDFVVQDFVDVDPNMIKDPSRGYLVSESMGEDYAHWYVANVLSFATGAVDGLSNDETASRVARTAVAFRAAGFHAVLLPGAPGEGVAEAAASFDSAGNPTRTFDALSALGSRLGTASLTLSPTGGWWEVMPDPPQVDQVLQVGLDLAVMGDIQLDPKSPRKLLDAFGQVCADLRYGPALADQLAAVKGRYPPYYVEGSLYSVYPDSVALGITSVFQNAWLVDAAPVIPTGELALNLDDDPDIELWGADGYYDPTGDGLFRKVAPGASYTSFTFYDLDRDGDTDLLFHEVQQPGASGHSVLFNEDGWFEPGKPLWNMGLPPETEEQLDLVLDQFAAQDFTGDGIPDLAGLDPSGTSVVLLEATGTAWSFLRHDYPIVGTPSVQSFTARDADGDGQMDLLAVGDPDQDGVTERDQVPWFLLRRQETFVAVQNPCTGLLLLTNEQMGLEDEVGPGFLCTLDWNPFLGIALYRFEGDTLVQVWQDTQLPGWDTGSYGTAVPYRDEQGADSRVVLASFDALHLIRIRASGLTVEKSVATAGQAVSGYYSDGPSGKTFLVAGSVSQAAVSTIEEAASLAPTQAAWQRQAPQAAGSVFVADQDEDSLLDAVVVAESAPEYKEINEVGKPFVSWWESKASVQVVDDVASGKGGATTLAEGLLIRRQNSCAGVPGDPPEAHSQPWPYPFAVGQLDGKKGLDVMLYSPVQHGLVDMQPTAYLVPGDGGAAIEIPAAEFLTLGVMNTSPCGKATLMAADMDEDGLDDVLLWNGQTGEVHMLCTDGGGGLDKHIRHEQVGVPLSRIMDRGDYNSDGHVDLLAVNEQEILVYLGNGQCGLAGKKDWTLGINIWFHNAASCGDVQSDGQTECFFECQWPDGTGAGEPFCAAVMPKQNGDLPFESRVPFPVGGPGTTASVTWGDFDGDGVPDVVLGAGEQANGVYSWHTDGLRLRGSYNPAPLAALGDVNGDGADDALGSGYTILLGRKAGD